MPDPTIDDLIDEATGGDGGDVPPDVYERYVNGEATADDLVVLVKANEITPGQAQEYTKANGPEDSLGGDLARMGLVPLTDDPNYYISSPNVTPNATRFADQYGNIVNQKGGNVTEAERKRLVGQYGGSSGTDNTVGLANLAQRQAEEARRIQEWERQQAERERAQRIAEAQDAIQMQQERRRAYLAAQMEGAGFSLPQGTTHFPGLGPDSPAVRSGLADPFRVSPVAYNPSMVLEQGNWQADLARLRAGSGG